MRIEPLKAQGKQKSKKGKYTLSSAGFGFKDVLKADQLETEEFLEFDLREVSQTDLSQLVDKIDELGQKLSRDPTPANFIRYKNRIRLFVSILKDNYEIKTTTSRINFRKTNFYQTVEVIDQKLSELANNLLSQVIDRISTLQLVENIKGLIVNLLM